MKTIFVVSCLLLALTTTSIQAAKIDNTLLARYICRTKENGFRSLVPGSCSQYYECENGKSQLRSCPRYYDSTKQSCVNNNPGCVETFSQAMTSSAAACSGPCCGIVNGGYAVNPSNPQIYYQCNDNCVVSQSQCSGNLMFDLVKQECASPISCPGDNCATTPPPCVTTTPPCTETPKPTTCTTTPCTTTTCTTTTCTTTTCTTTTCTTTTCTTTTCTTTTCTTTTCTTTTCTTTTCTTTTCTTTTCTTTTCTTTTCTTTTCTTTTCTTTTCTTTTCTTTTCTTTTSTTTTSTTTTRTTTTRTTTTCTTTTCTTTTCTTTTCTTTTCTTTTCTTTTCTTTTCTTTTCTTTTCTTTTCTTTPCTTTTICTTTTCTPPPCRTTTPKPCIKTTTCTTTACPPIVPAKAIRPLRQPTQSFASSNNDDRFIRFACRDKPNGFMLASSRSCNDYYICRSGQALPVSCGNKYFNALKGICDLPGNTNCQQRQ